MWFLSNLNPSGRRRTRIDHDRIRIPSQDDELEEHEEDVVEDYFQDHPDHRHNDHWLSAVVDSENVSHRSAHTGTNHTTTSMSTSQMTQQLSESPHYDIELANHQSLQSQSQLEPQSEQMMTQDSTTSNSSSSTTMEYHPTHHQRNSTTTCNIFTLLLLFQFWIVWSETQTMLSAIVLSVLSLVVIAIHYQITTRDHDDPRSVAQEQEQVVLSLLTSSSSPSSTGTHDHSHTHAAATTTATTTESTDSTTNTQRRSSRRGVMTSSWDELFHHITHGHSNHNNGSHDHGNMHHIDLSMLSYQAQLAYAIMESQRYILETGGYGRPDGPEDKQGVRSETIEKWKTFRFNPLIGGDVTVRENVSTSTNTSSNTSSFLGMKSLDKESPTCCICLSEYEKNEELKEITPCGHWYHSMCILEWVKHHTTCPLCQVELEDSPNS